MNRKRLIGILVVVGFLTLLAAWRWQHKKKATRPPVAVCGKRTDKNKIIRLWKY
jgi:hypothetical protein